MLPAVMRFVPKARAITARVVIVTRRPVSTSFGDKIKSKVRDLVVDEVNAHGSARFIFDSASTFVSQNRARFALFVGKS